MLNRINMLLIAFILCWNAYDIAQLKAAKTALSLDKIAAYDYLLVDHEEEINKLKKAIAKINASCYNE